MQDAEAASFLDTDTRLKAEKAKIILSSSEETVVQVGPFMAGNRPKMVPVKLTRADLLECTAGLRTRVEKVRWFSFQCSFRQDAN